MHLARKRSRPAHYHIVLGVNMSSADKALALFQRYNCAQSVLGAIGPDKGLDEKTCLIISSAFGGGMARQGEVCGAVTGALMAIGLDECKTMSSDPAGTRARLYSRAEAFMIEFKQRSGSLQCRELTGCDLRTPKGQEKFKPLHHSLCEKLIAGAIEILEAQKH